MEQSPSCRETDLRAGKIAADTFQRVIRPHLGAQRNTVLVGPRHGVDAGIVDLGNGQVMAITTDPFFVLPELGWKRAAWFAVNIVASDAATTGLRPAYLAVDLNLPASISAAEFETLWLATSDACTELGLSIVTGHTGAYDNCAYPMLGGATVVATGDKDAYVTPNMAGVGDVVIVTKGAAIEATAMFGGVFPDLLRREVGVVLATAAEALFWQMSVVKDAAVASGVGVRERGVTGMHDATERGVWGGLVEIAQAAGVGMVIDPEAVIVRPEVRAVCDLFDFDPFVASSAGTLLITCRPHASGEIIERLGAIGIVASIVGEIEPRERGIRLLRNGVEVPLEAPVADPFWPAFARTLRQEPECE